MSSAVSHSQQEKFCLRWNDFESNLSEAFKELRQESQFLDVSLLCDGDQQIEAHRVVLSACSGFFRNVLRRSRHQHPLVYLKGIHQADLNHILDFIYYGEVSISQENLNSFLSVAEELKIKGLTQNNLNLEEGKAKTTRSATPVRAGASERKISPTEELVEVKDEDSAQPPTGSQEMEASEMFDDDIQYEDENQFQDIYQSQAGNQELELDSLISTAMFKDQVTKEWRCNFCSKSHKDKARITRHVEIHFPGFTQSCPYCCKELPSRNSLRVHISDAHTNVNKNQY